MPGGRKQPSERWAGSRGWAPGDARGSWPFLPSHSDLSLLTLGSEKGLENEIHRRFRMEKCNKHQHKQRNNLKELGKWERQGQDYKSSWKNANGYVWGQIIHKPDIHWAGKDRRASCKMVASDSCRDQGGVGLEDGWSFWEAYIEVGVDLILGLPRLSPYLTRSQPILMSVGVGWGKVHCEIGIWRKQVTFQPSGICYGVSYPNCILFALLFLLYAFF